MQIVLANFRLRRIVCQYLRLQILENQLNERLDQILLCRAIESADLLGGEFFVRVWRGNLLHQDKPILGGLVQAVHSITCPEKGVCLPKAGFSWYGDLNQPKLLVQLLLKDFFVILAEVFVGPLLTQVG